MEKVIKIICHGIVYQAIIAHPFNIADAFTSLFRRLRSYNSSAQRVQNCFTLFTMFHKTKIKVEEEKKALI